MVDFNKIIIVSLCDKLTKDLAKLLSQSLDMIYCDVEDLIEYELIDKNALENLCSKEYLDDLELQTIRHIASFEGVVIGINYDYLTKHINILKQKSVIAFLNVEKNKVKTNPINFVAYEQRTARLKRLSDFVVDVKNEDLQNLVEQIINILGGLL